MKKKHQKEIIKTIEGLEIDSFNIHAEGEENICLYCGVTKQRSTGRYTITIEAHQEGFKPKWEI